MKNSVVECKVGNIVSGFGSDWSVDAVYPDGRILARDINTDSMRTFNAQEAEQLTVVSRGMGNPGQRAESTTKNRVDRILGQHGNGQA